MSFVLFMLFMFFILCVLCGGGDVCGVMRKMKVNVFCWSLVEGESWPMVPEKKKK